MKQISQHILSKKIINDEQSNFYYTHKGYSAQQRFNLKRTLFVLI